ncbi:Cobalt-zinc-cadmium resistance protein CzcA Cation efflux system protein CusA [Dickeya dianthicola RNS04.9]|nr:Cobalt-zinc-cadmium resistance protein CzcA Cation efflux system protein CusA [Dickeya dianthicola RNS04.9]
MAIATLLCSTLFSAPLLAERHQTHTMTGNMGNMSHMSNMSHSMQSGMNLDMSSMTANAATVYRTTGTVKQWNASDVTLALTLFPLARLGSEFMPPLDEGDLLYNAVHPARHFAARGRPAVATDRPADQNRAGSGQRVRQGRRR